MSGSQGAYQPTAAQDVVAIFDANFNQIFVNARPLKATVRRPAKLMKHPVESGSVISDHRVIEPIHIDLPMVLTPAFYVDTYNEIISVFNGNATIQVQTNVGLFQNMMLQDPSHMEDPEHFDTITMTLKLEQVIIVTAKRTTAVSTAKGGNKTGKEATATEGANAGEKTKKSSAAFSLLFGKGENHSGGGE